MWKVRPTSTRSLAPDQRSGTERPSILPKRGFTLIELLVVISILAILASLLLPALSRAKQAADNAVCRNNLRQQAIALAMYVGDFGVYPLYRTPPSSDPNAPARAYWPQMLEPLLGNKWPAGNLTFDVAFGTGVPSPRGGIFACPGYNKIRGLYQGYDPQHWWDEPDGAYGYNAAYDLELIPSGGAVGLLGLSSCYDAQVFPQYASIPGVVNLISEGEVVNPSRMIAIGDSEITPPEPITLGGDAYLRTIPGR